MRIIGGQLKGRAILPPPAASQTRPITGLVKKSLFGMLGEDLTGYVVLDLYCGTGTLGLEALSRGATRCWFAECDGKVVRQLKRNIDELRVSGRSAVWVGDVAARLALWLGEVPQKIDLAFVDPPYEQARQWDWLSVTRTIFAPLAGRLAADGVVTLRAPVGLAVPDELGGLQVVRRRTYGDMGLWLLKLRNAD
jgi:16S rRNA (guanine966-N2)-methyltransferase